MFATVTTWRLAPSVQSESAQNQILPELTSRAIAIARQYGILDFIMVPVSPVLLMVVSSYETEQDASLCGPPLLAFLTENYADKIELLDRSVGPAFEPGDLVELEKRDARLWRDEATAMFANINRYRVDPSIREESAFDAFLERISARFVAVLSRMNLLDMLVVRNAPDELMVLRLFEDPVAFDDAIARAKEFFTEDPFEGRLTHIESLRGRAFDANFLTRS